MNVKNLTAEEVEKLTLEDVENLTVEEFNKIPVEGQTKNEKQNSKNILDGLKNDKRVVLTGYGDVFTNELLSKEIINSIKKDSETTILTAVCFNEEDATVDVSKYLDDKDINCINKVLTEPTETLKTLGNREIFQEHSDFESLLNTQNRLSSMGTKYMQLRDFFIQELKKLDKEILDIKAIYNFIRENLNVKSVLDPSSEYNNEKLTYDCERNATMDEYPDGEIVEDENNE